MKALRMTLVLGLAALAALALPATSLASFGFADFSVTATGEGGVTPTNLAGLHPYSLVTKVKLNQTGGISDGDLRDLSVEFPAGLVENPSAVPTCSATAFSTPRTSPFEESMSGEDCPTLSQIGIATIESSRGGGETRTFGVFNLAPPQGSPSRFGFSPYGAPITFTPQVREAGGEYRLTLNLRNFTQKFDVTGFELTIWGSPWALSHKDQRGNCLNELEPEFGWAKCLIKPLSPAHAPYAYLTLPTSCGAPLSFRATATAWDQPGVATATSTATDPIEDCDGLDFEPFPTGTLSTTRASAPSGFEFTLAGGIESFLGPAARSASPSRTATLSMPPGMAVSPSVAGGLGSCSEAQFAAETAFSQPGEGCPNASKIGELRIDSPLVEGTIQGSMFFATPFENRFGTMLALYLVAKSPERGINVKLAGRVVADPATGQLTTVFDELPQLPYSRFAVFFREGQRSPLATPDSCGSYATGFAISPWRDPGLVRSFSSPFVLDSGAGGGPCPGSPPPFSPGAVGGSLNANAASYSPFYLHLTRTDAEQEITSYSASLPPGLLGKLAGIPFCSEEQIAAAKRQSGAESEAAPACPAASLIGHTYTGYGVGSSPAYAPGTLYLAGPYHGSPISTVAIDSAKVGPFDLGTVVIRSAIRINRRTAQVAIDSAGSDPIPHILSGVPLRLRDIRISIDRPQFTVTPSSCAPFSLVSSLTGAGANLGDPGDDSSASATSRYQVSNCSSLGFGPRLAISLRGGHKRGAYPALRAVVTPSSGDSHLATATVALSRRIFLAQEHLKTVCTPKQFDAHACPAESIYGTATAVTPLLEEPMSGPVYLRSNGREGSIPDLVAALSGRGIEIDVAGQIDSYKGGLRARFTELPDAPLTKFTMDLYGGKRGILTNATNICTNPQTAQATFTAADEAVYRQQLPLQAKCPKKKKKGGRK